ncbi:ABC transporter permease [Plantibacter sp. CFBP 8804]|uniref:ABC transporter permease n=1 Tax=Plantibacter sp. CFBP 8804 TaxID=2775270 RepID=UPI00178582A8|nr:ABC transporter permease [Plantibacter sp. CFBP 8804]MBD8517648.1 ABC transporter permease [Plantibacter sp. CFBP 8804]
MFGTYLRRELVGRRKQTIIIAIGMALAIALVIIVNSVAAGVKTAQASVLESVYGVGTDITVSQAAEAPTEGGGPGQNFDFGSGDGSTSDGTTTVNQSRLEAARGTSTFDATALGTITDVANVEAAAATLSLTNTTFTGELPDFSQAQGSDGTAGAPGGDPSGATPPQGGPDGAGGSSFGVDSFTVLGLDPSGDAVGPLSAVTLSDGRSLAADDTGTDVAVLDASYATEAGIATGDTIDIAGTTFSVVGTVTASGADATTASNVYIPLDVAQTLAGLDGQVSDVYVQAASSTDITQVQTDIEAALPDATVSTQEDLASTVSGSLASASTLVSNLGTWLSLIVLAAAFLIAILFTISGVTRRTREFGTLKAIGWSDRRIVGQVAGESVVQSLIGGAVGVAVGLVGILVVNLVAPTLSAAATTSAGGGLGGPGGAAGMPSDAAAGAAGGFGGAPGAAAATTTDIVLQAPVTAWIIVIAVGIAVLGGLLAGAIGGWRASRLRPAEALRSVA